jgi:hypothetical protein
MSPVQFQTVESQLGILQQMEGGIGHPLVLRRASHPKVSLAAIYPWQGVTHAIELGKLQFVCRGDEVVAGIVIVCGRLVAVGNTPRRL